MKKIKSMIILFVFLDVIWLLLTMTLQRQEFVAGLIVCFLIVLIFGRKIGLFEEVRLGPKAIVFAVGFVFIFLFELIKSNLDVAFRVIHPKLPINPGIVKVRTRLRSPLGRLVLANAITLTPGTFTIETDQDFFYIHWIDVAERGVAEATGTIVEKFEKYLEVVFG